MIGAPTAVLKAVVYNLCKRLRLHETVVAMVSGYVDEARAREARLPYCPRCRIVIEGV